MFTFKKSLTSAYWIRINTVSYFDLIFQFEYLWRSYVVIFSCRRDGFIYLFFFVEQTQIDKSYNSKKNYNILNWIHNSVKSYSKREIKTLNKSFPKRNKRAHNIVIKLKTVKIKTIKDTSISLMKFQIPFFYFK